MCGVFNFETNNRIYSTMLNLVIFGGPGSGKGTQSENIVKEYSLFHISTGDVLRRIIASGSQLGQQVDSIISKGNLIPDEMMVEILANELDSNPATANGVIFDGFPRTINQAKALKHMLANRNTKVHAVIGLEVDDEQLTQRLLKRGQDSGRSDDNIETIKQRLDVYHNQTSPLRDYYVNEGKYLAIDGTGTIEQITTSIIEAVNNHVK